MENYPYVIPLLGKDKKQINGCGVLVSCFICGFPTYILYVGTKRVAYITEGIKTPVHIYPEWWGSVESRNACRIFINEFAPSTFSVNNAAGIRKNLRSGKFFMEKKSFNFGG